MVKLNQNHRPLHKLNHNARPPVLIGIDWGTTSFRAFLIDAQGTVLDSLSTAKGIMQIPDQDYSNLLTRLLAPWSRYTAVPIIASGMITSRNGWFETPYIEAPAGIAEMAAGLVAVDAWDGRRINFVTGLSTDNGGTPDVMRGEETQIAGAVAQDTMTELFVMPGTHSKWVLAGNRRIIDFRTFMTGEVFAALRDHTILGTLMQNATFSESAFREGVQAGRQSGPNLLHSIFSARTKPLFGKLGQDKVADYLSGLLIGAEIQGALSQYGTEAAIVIVGGKDLSSRYEIALQEFALRCSKAGEDIVASGHHAIAAAAGLIN